jgi:hypothetical protein
MYASELQEELDDLIDDIETEFNKFIIENHDDESDEDYPVDPDLSYYDLLDVKGEPLVDKFIEENKHQIEEIEEIFRINDILGGLTDDIRLIPQDDFYEEMCDLIDESLDKNFPSFIQIDYDASVEVLTSGYSTLQYKDRIYYYYNY